ncbi:MAG TPA: PEGA domain-containing protein [Vicinamibacterales bacterium]|nr:PEGA domain-containing protein [Vicinamibacterales bacterium]
MKETSVILAVALLLMLAASPIIAQNADDQGRGQARSGQARGGQTQRQHPQAPKSAPPAQHRPPQRPLGTTGVSPHARPRVPHAGLRSRVYPEPRGYDYAPPRAVVPTIVYPHPHFWFRPWLWLGFGIYIGYPVPYPVAYCVPTYVYGDGVIYPAPDAYGGISLSIVPDDASVIVDGSYVGLARDFGPARQPLTLTPGRHHVELEVPGSAPLAFDVDIVAGQVVPYGGRLQPE